MARGVKELNLDVAHRNHAFVGKQRGFCSSLDDFVVGAGQFMREHFLYAQLEDFRNATNVVPVPVGEEGLRDGESVSFGAFEYFFEVETWVNDARFPGFGASEDVVEVFMGAAEDLPEVEREAGGGFRVVLERVHKVHLCVGFSRAPKWPAT